MINERYIAYIVDYSHESESIDYEMEFTSFKEAVSYIRSLPNTRCCGHLEKLALIDGDWFSDTIMHF